MLRGSSPSHDHSEHREMAYRNREREIWGRRGRSRLPIILRGTVGYRGLGLGGTVPNELADLTSGEWGGWRGSVDSEKKQKRTLGVERGQIGRASCRERV